MDDDDANRLHCRHCLDVIGAYEPLVLADEADRRVTSLATEPWLRTARLPCYHRSCYEQLTGGAGTDWRVHRRAYRSWADG